MPGAVKHKLLFYADDSAILLSSKCRHDIETFLTYKMAVLSQWLISNKLSLHLGTRKSKTEAVLQRRPMLKLGVICKFMNRYRKCFMS